MNTQQARKVFDGLQAMSLDDAVKLCLSYIQMAISAAPTDKDANVAKQYLINAIQSTKRNDDLTT